MHIKKSSSAKKGYSIKRVTADYYLFIGGAELGPIKIKQLWELYWEGRITDRDQYWTKGLNDWTPIPALYHPSSRPYVTPPEEELSTPMVPSKLGIFSRLFRRSDAEGEGPNLMARCRLCNGPAWPENVAFCGACGLFCRQCTIKMRSGKCPKCGGNTSFKK
jgi:hypothetical protein